MPALVSVPASAALLAFPFITHADITAALVGYWTFDGPDMNWPTGTAIDRSGQSNNGKSRSDERYYECCFGETWSSHYVQRYAGQPSGS